MILRPTTNRKPYAPLQRGSLFIRLLLLLFIFNLQASIFNLSAATYTPDNLPIPYLQNRTRYVSNPDGILSAAAEDSLNIMLRNMEVGHGVQTVLAVVEHVDGADTYDFCMRLARKYGIGSKSQNSGLVVLLATGDRAYTILTGRGLEGTLPDAICKRIENRQMLPSLREGNWDAAMLNTVRAITTYVDGDDSLVGSSDFDEESDAALYALLLFILGFAALMLFMAYLAERKRRYCPSCGKYNMKKISTRATRNKALGLITHHDTYRCTHCYFTKEVHWDENIHDDFTKGFGAGTIGGSFGGFSGRGGTGFTGGHFGGGSFGGGGASGRF